MKFRSPFDLATDTSDVLDFFDGVETPEQMISRLERLKKNDTEDFLLCIEALRGTLTALLEDTIEMTPSGPESETGADDDDDLDLSQLIEDENDNSTPQDNSGEPKS